MSNKITKLFTALLMMAVLVSCSNRGLKKQEMGADKYFEYAKAKFDKGDNIIWRSRTLSKKNT